MVEFTSLSGKQVVINPAAFEDAMELKNAIARELAKSGIDLQVLVSSENDPNFKIDAKSIISAVLMVDSAKDVNKALFACLLKCTYDKEKITTKSFEPIENRGDYYQVVLECLQVNIVPFFTGLGSKLNGIKSLLLSKFQPQK